MSPLPAPPRYTTLPGNADPSTKLRTGRVYQAICQTLAARKERVDWPQFGDAEWRLMGTMAKTEGVGPLLYWNFRDGGWPEGMPGRLQASLTQSYYNTVAHNTLLYQELDRILAALNEAHIPVIVLKGAALAATLYEDIGLRPMGDLDLLVQEDGLSQAAAVVRKFDYAPARPELGAGLDRLVSYEVNFEGGEHVPILVELHWNLIGSEASCYRPEVEWFWKQTRNYIVPANGQQLLPNIFTLAPEAHLLYQAAHLMIKHNGVQERLLWFYDLHLLLVHWGRSLNWDNALMQASNFRWSAALFAALTEFSLRFGTLLPNDLLERLSRDVNVSDQKRIQQKIHANTRLKSTWVQLMSLNWYTRLRLILSLIFPSPAYMRWRYHPDPDWLWPLYYPYRWLDVLGDVFYTITKKAFMSIE